MIPRLGVNVDHIATLRQARGTTYPDPVAAALIAEQAGADQITIHLREDRRHIQDRDVRIMREVLQTRLNLEMGATEEMVRIAIATNPDQVTLVPEKREELTTEGGLDCAGLMATLRPAVDALQDAGILVSVFIDPNMRQLEATVALNVPMIELHTGEYAEHQGARQVAELERLRVASLAGAEMGLIVAAGHGLEYKNVIPLVGIVPIEEYNIGHSIVARAAMVGFERAVSEMIAAIRVGFDLR